jgi:hypothetical protein
LITLRRINRLLRHRSAIVESRTLNLVERDRQTGMGEIIATTPTSKPVYVLGKWLSNLFNTGQMVFSATPPVLRQLPATWLAGVAATFVAGSGAWLHLALAGETVSPLGWAVDSKEGPPFLP